MDATSPPWTPESPLEPPWALDPDCPRVERYLLGPEIGRGGMGRVHLAWDPFLRRPLAVKVLHGDDPEQHLRLLREARNQAKLDHPRVCRIHDLGMEGERPYIAMQLIQGGPLPDLRPELDFRALAALLAEVAGAVHAAHLAGLIHRDLKPANILVAGRGKGTLVPFVVDFGLARDFRSGDQTLSWAVLGTPAFMSPEQARGEALGPATDIYSLGATLYAMLSGNPPYEGSTLGGLLAQQSDRAVRPLRRLDRTIPKDLETITLKCLEAEPQGRYPTALALEQDLRRWLAGEPVQARAVGPAGRLWRWSRRKPALAATAAAGLLTAALLGGWNARTLRVSRLREQAAQRFGMEIRDAEHLLRIERMMPLHDIRPAEARLRARMAAIRAEMARAGGIARGPGLYALGRGHLALDEPGKALESLDQAWAEGFRAPEVAYAIGLAHLTRVDRRVQEMHAESRTPEETGKAKAELALPALGWMERAKGAQVDHPDYGAALVARACNRFEEADALFQAALKQAPWLYEAWLGRYQNGVEWRSSLPSGQGTAESFLRDHGAWEDMLGEAEKLAPSDAGVARARASALTSRFITESARRRRDPERLTQALAYLEKARVISPDALDLARLGAMLVMQRGFHQLSIGEDPAGAAREEAHAFAGLAGRTEGRTPPEVSGDLGTLHHLWWIAAEADLRYGRDPGPALAEAARLRDQRTVLDPHHLFPLILEAVHQAGRGRDPGAAFGELEARIAALSDKGLADAFSRTIFGEAMLEKARWLAARGGPWREPADRGARWLREAEEGVPDFIYTYYHLPRLLAFQARMALREGRDPGPLAAAALESARRGVAINGANAEVRLAAAEAWLADGMVRRARGEDPGSSLDRAREAVAAGERTNPRLFSLSLAAAEADLEAAAWARAQGADPGPFLARAAGACRKGLGTKGDEARFHGLLAAIAAARGEDLRRAGGSPLEAQAEALRHARRALALRPGESAAVEALRALDPPAGRFRAAADRLPPPRPPSRN